MRYDSGATLTIQGETSRNLKLLRLLELKPQGHVMSGPVARYTKNPSKWFVFKRV